MTTETYTAQSADQPWNIGVTVSPEYERFELRQGDQWPNDIPKGDSRERVSLRGNTYWPFATDIWFAGQCRITTNGWRSDTGQGFYNEFFTTYHNVDSGESGSFKKAEMNMSIRFNSSGQPRLQINTSGDPTGAFLSTSSEIDTRYDVAFTPLIGTWMDWVVRLRFAKGTRTGQAQVWLNQTQLFNLSGIACGYNDNQGPYFKRGMYRTSSPYGVVVEWANCVLGTASQAGRVSSPVSPPSYSLPVPVDA